ncbi:MAG TPA: copper resistance protein NlpE N-terminal domain-containing protein [Ignavibacteriaceae bacterium]|nr:copper resistance protein NlpE N-terminal domain-containing protein [Ignavibacteriaceae bacterium]
MKTLFYSAMLLSVFLILNGCGTSNMTSSSTSKENINSHNAQNSLDWSGVYKGVVPCADCEGIETILILNKDLSYVLKTSYLGKENNPFIIEGNFIWNESSNKITLSGIQNAPNSFFVGENLIYQLDMDGNRITGELSENYALRKELSGSDLEISNKYYKLIELMGKPVIASEHQKKEIHIIFNSEGNRIHGFSGCNTFNGSYELKNINGISFSKVATTLMACPEMETEKQFHQILEMTDNYFFDGKYLQFNKAKMAPLAKFEVVWFR